MEEEERGAWFDALEWTRTGYLDLPDPVPTGIPSLDHHLVDGMRPGVYTILGRPGEGKSALALMVAATAAVRGDCAAVLSLEMPAHDAWLRAASAWSCTVGEDVCPSFSWSASQQSARISVEYGGKSLSSGGDPVITAARVMAARRVPLLVAEPESPTIDEVLGLLAEAKARGARLAVVDYLQLVDVPGVEREYERVSAAMRALALFAREEELPVLLVAAMNREGLTGGASMHSAAGSSLVEYASTCVMTYVRDKEAEATDPPGTRTMLLNIEKNRCGMVTMQPIRLRYWPAFNWVQEVV